MYNTLGFFNSYMSGDIFESREFVRDIMETHPAKKYVYYHNNSDRLLLDIDNLTVIPEVPKIFNHRIPFIDDTANNNLFINTWIGRDPKYVLPGAACTLEQLYKMYNDMLSQIDGSFLSNHVIDYLTTIDYSKFDIEKIDEYMLRNMGRKMVFISNGEVRSLQAKNFDMSYLIERLADAYPSIIFFITSPMKRSRSNIVNANDFTDSSLTSNLNELSYLSTFCDIIVGRNSGPQVFSWTKGNCLSSKTNVTFSYNENCRHFVHHTGIGMSRLWSNSTCVKKTFNFLSDVISKEIQ